MGGGGIEIKVVGLRGTNEMLLMRTPAERNREDQQRVLLGLVHKWILTTRQPGAQGPLRVMLLETRDQGINQGN